MSVRDKRQDTLFDNPRLWRDEWNDMPEFHHTDLAPVQKIVVNFKTREDVIAFARLIGQVITKRTDTIWFPKRPKWVSLNKVYVDEP